MKCPNCGTEIEKGDAFCPECGKKEPLKGVKQKEVTQYPGGFSTKYGVASFVCGLVGLLFSFIPFLGLMLSIFGVIFYSKQKKLGKTGLATAGLVLGIIGAVLGTITILTMLGRFGSFSLG